LFNVGGSAGKRMITSSCPINVAQASGLWLWDFTGWKPVPLFTKSYFIFVRM
jgi:hypothetical protein